MLDSDESSTDSENEEKKKEEKEEEKAAEEEEKAAGKKGKKKKDKDASGDKDDKGGKKSNKSSANNSRATTPTPGTNMVTLIQCFPKTGLRTIYGPPKFLNLSVEFSLTQNMRKYDSKYHFIGQILSKVVCGK